MPAPVRIGLAGYGLGGRYFSCAADRLRRDLRAPRGGHHLGERRREVAADLGRPAFASLEELAGAGAEAVRSPPPAATHVTLTQQALRLGLAVGCDKPFAPDARDIRPPGRRARRAARSPRSPCTRTAAGIRISVPVDPWDAVATAAVLDAARTSAHTAQVVSPAQTT